MAATARELARSRPEPANGYKFGVLIHQQEAVAPAVIAPYVTVIYGAAQIASYPALEWTIGTRSQRRVDLPSAIRILVSDGGPTLHPLDGDVAWFYAYGTGVVLKPNASGYDAYCAIGGAPYQRTPFYRAMPVSGPSLQPPPTGNPNTVGLQVSSADGRARVGIVIDPIGTVLLKDQARL